MNRFWSVNSSAESCRSWALSDFATDFKEVLAKPNISFAIDPLLAGEDDLDHTHKWVLAPNFFQ